MDILLMILIGLVTFVVGFLLGSWIGYRKGDDRHEK